MEKIHAVFILEMLGRPKEHLEESMNQIVEAIEKDKTISLKNKKVSNAKKIEETKDMFSLFSEIEAEFDDLFSLMRLVFTYTPSHFEIISPENLRMRNYDLNTFFNELIKRMHQYDEVVKTTVIQKDALESKFDELVGLIKKKDKKFDLDEFLGVKEKEKQGKEKTKTVGKRKSKK